MERCLRDATALYYVLGIGTVLTVKGLKIKNTGRRLPSMVIHVSCTCWAYSLAPSRNASRLRHRTEPMRTVQG